MQVVINRREKEEPVIQLYQQGKTMRVIASAAHMSIADIKVMIRKIDGQDDGINTDIKDLKNKSKDAQALYLFSIGKKPIEVAIELDLPPSVVYDIQEEFWALNDLYDLAFVYSEISPYLSSFLTLFRYLKKHKMLGEKQITKVLEYTKDLSHLTDRIQCLTNNLIVLESKERDLMNRVVLWNAQLSDLENVFDLRLFLKMRKVS